MPIGYRCPCDKSFEVDDQFLGQPIRCPYCGQVGTVQISETLTQVEQVALEEFVPPIPPLVGAGPPRGSADRWVEQPGFHS